MNFTAQYIKMVDCPEIQDGWVPKLWQFCMHRGEAELSQISCHGVAKDKNGYWTRTQNTVFGIKSTHTINLVWLPTQQDLQEMSGLDWLEFDCRCMEYVSRDMQAVLSCSKLEAGIQVVMKLHHKQWNGNEWVKEEDYRDAAIDYQADVKEATNED